MSTLLLSHPCVRVAAHAAPARRAPAAWATAIVGHRAFAPAVIASVALGAVVVGLETSPAVVAAAGPWLVAAHGLVLALFAAEVGVRIVAHGRAFFRSGWNLFDLALLLASLVPAVGVGATAARIARILRVTRLTSASPKLRLIVATMFRSIPSLGHVGLLLALLLYVYGVLGVHLFREADPAHWASLPQALLTLFQVLTLEGWVELQRAGMTATPWAWVYFGSFVLIAVFVVVNLFIAVVLTNLEEARRELEPAALAPAPAPRPRPRLRPRAARYR